MTQEPLDQLLARLRDSSTLSVEEKDRLLKECLSEFPILLNTLDQYKEANTIINELNIRIKEERDQARDMAAGFRNISIEFGNRMSKFFAQTTEVEPLPWENKRG